MIDRPIAVLVCMMDKFELLDAPRWHSIILIVSLIFYELFLNFQSDQGALNVCSSRK